jgi:hypothetical protein
VAITDLAHSYNRLPRSLVHVRFWHIPAIIGRVVDRRQSATKIVRQPENSGDRARSNSSDKMSTTRNEEGGDGAAVAKRAGLQASRAWSVLSVDGCYLGWSPKMIGDWHHGTPTSQFRRVTMGVWGHKHRLQQYWNSLAGDHVNRGCLGILAHAPSMTLNFIGSN